MYSYIGWLTLVFAIAYFKRFFMVCISVIFAPVFSVMYAFGQQTKQMYTNWLKDFIMAVFVQPFHIVVYSILLAIPMGFGGGNSGWSSMYNSVWNFIYGLTAMTMIRPAEKWLRSMFGMDKGLAGMASYDSGMKTFQALAKAVVTVVSAVAAAYTGGASLKAGEAMKNMIGNGGQLKNNKPGDGGLTQLSADASSNAEVTVPDKKEDNSLLTTNNPNNTTEVESAEQNKAQLETNNGTNQSSSAIDAATVMITAGAVQMDGKGAIENKNSKDTGEIKSIDTSKEADKNKEKNDKEDDGVSLEEGKKGFLAKFQDFMASDSMNAGIEIFKGLGSIGDSLYVDGNGPQDWKQTAEIAGMLHGRAKDKRKQELDNEKANWANDKGNISYMTDKYLPEMLDKYKDKGPDEAKRRAEEKAKAELTKMSAYVEFGITDIATVSELYSKQKQYGFTPREMVLNEAGYKSFNENAANVTTINQDVRITGDNHTTVESAIPNAREYYNAGVTSIDSMRWVDEIATKLKKSAQEAVKIDETLRNKGKINYNGSNKEMKDVVSQINKHYNN